VTTIAFDSYWTGSKDCDLFSVGAFNLKTAKPERRLDREVDLALVSSIIGLLLEVFANFTTFYLGLSREGSFPKAASLSERPVVAARPLCQIGPAGITHGMVPARFSAPRDRRSRQTVWHSARLADLTIAGESPIRDLE
jgi:hypothetical protein